MEELSDMEKVQEALDLLDIDEKEHWTTEDLPRIEVVAGLSGVLDLKRDTLTKMFPDFVRYPKVETVTVVEEVEEVVPEPTSRETYEGINAELEARIGELNQEREALRVQIEALQGQVDANVQTIVKEFPPPSAAVVQRQYAQNQLKRATEAAEKQAVIQAIAQKVINDSK